MAWETRWRVWVARAAVVAAVAVVVVAFRQLWGYANGDDPEYVEQPDIIAMGAAACAQMRDTTSAAAVGANATLPQRVGAINAQNDAVIDMVKRMKSLGPKELTADQPAAEWVHDWERLVAAREAYARSLVAGKPKPLALPVVDGRPLVDRLNNSGVSCRVPLVLLAP